MTGKPDLSGLLASRICHDLVSPVGALVNGVDLMVELGAGDLRDEVTMIGESARRASAVLQFYRVAFGAAEESDAPIARLVLRDQAEAMIATQRLALDWDGMDGPPITRREGRLLFLLLMCAKALAGMGGRIDVNLPDGSRQPIRISVWPGAGAGQAPNRDLIRLLSPDADLSAVGPRQVEFALGHRAAGALEARIAVEERGGGVEITAGPAQPAETSRSVAL